MRTPDTRRIELRHEARDFTSLLSRTVQAEPEMARTPMAQVIHDISREIDERLARLEAEKPDQDIT